MFKSSPEQPKLELRQVWINYFANPDFDALIKELLIAAPILGHVMDLHKEEGPGNEDSWKLYPSSWCSYD